MLRTLMASILAGCLVSAVQAQTGNATPAASADAWRFAPYQLMLVIHVEQHPLLTDEFVRRLRSEVQDALQRDLGDLCSVEAVAEHPLMTDVLAKGWGELDQRKYPIDDRKVHLLRISYDNGQYLIQARQVDGSTGLVSPLRRTHTPDRLWVARLVALTVAQDFGIVGQVSEVIDQTVTVRLRGQGPNDPESIRVRVGEVFALSEIRQGASGKLDGLRIPDALLVVSDIRPGECTTRLFHRRKEILRPKSTYRAIKLGTQQAQLQLRVVDHKTKEPLTGCGVQVFTSSFDGRPVEELSTNSQGRIRTKDTYRNVVFVKLTIAGLGVGEVAFPLVDDQPIEYPVTNSQEAERLARFDYRRKQWERQLRDLDLAMDNEASQIRDLQAKNQERQAVAKAKEVYARLSTELEQTEKDLEEVRAVGLEANPQAVQNVLARAQQYLDRVKNRLKGFEEYVQDVENPTPARIALKKARQYDRAFDADNAIKLYKESLQLDPNQGDEIKGRLDKIEDAWRVKGEAHRQARQFISETWETVPPEEMEKRLVEAQNAFKECQRARDFFSAYKLFRVNQEHQQKLTASVQSLSGAGNDEAQERISFLEKLFDELQKFNELVATYVDSASR